MSPLTIVGNPFAGAASTWAKPTVNPGNTIPVDAQGRIVNQAASPIAPIVLIYYNLGDAKVSGTDIGVNYAATDRVELRGTLSTVKIDDLVVPVGGSPVATSLNAPTTKWTLGATAKDIGMLSFGATWRNVNAYYFRSGSNTGVIPTFGTLDANVSLKLPAVQNTMVNLGVSNLLSCTAENFTYGTPAGAQPNSRLNGEREDRKCGFSRKHIEMIHMPQIGTMAFLGLRFQR
jgi:iron complex outermembrane receptor protein